nr:EOG090X0F6V [Eulimnadia texana]
MDPEVDQYKEEQLGEIGALESIYPDELEILNDDPYHEFTINVKSEEHGGENEVQYACKLKFVYTKTYPEEPPVIDVLDEEGMDDEQALRLKEHLEKEAEDNLGMVMVFTLVSSANEWLEKERVAEIQRKEDEKERLKQEAEEAEKRKFMGTPVSIENFLAWKEKFDAEMRALKMKDIKEDKEKKATGRELFMRDQTLNESDLKFLEEGGEVVKVDESLFQDLDDLDLDEELDEDFE